MDKRLKGHLPALDGIRGVAILLVVLFHTARPDATNRAELAVDMAMGFGWAGVDLFFVLSGFLITGILLDARGSTHYYRGFYARRALRIFPLYFGYCAVLFLLLPVVYGWGTLGATRLHEAAPWYLSYAMNVRVALEGGWSAAVGGTAMFWSLCVEEQFYLVWPWIVARLGRARLVPLCLAMIATALFVRFISVHIADNIFAAYVLLPARMDALAAGALVAALARAPNGLDRLARLAPAGLATSGVGLMVLVLRIGYTGWDHPLMATFGYSLIAVGCASGLVLVLTTQPTQWLHIIAVSRPLRFFGKYSYGMYILGGAGGMLLALTPLPLLLPARVGGSAIPTIGLTLLVDLVVIVGLALVSWAVVERQAMLLKGRFPYSRAQPSSASVPNQSPLALASETLPATISLGTFTSDQHPHICDHRKNG